MERIDALRTSVDTLSAESQQLRREMRRRTRVLGWLFAGGGIILTCCLLAAYTVSLNNQRDIAANNRKLCPMVGLLISRPGQQQPTTPRGIEIARQAQHLYESYGCPSP